MYKETLHKLHKTILDANVGHSKSMLKQNPRISKEKQLAVYMDGYRIRLAEAVRSDHPAFCNYMGKKADKIIKQFVETVNSDSYSLDFYPFKFAEYVKDKRIPRETKELIRLESDIAQVFMDKDSEPLKAETIVSMNEAQLDAFRFAPRTASRIESFEYDVERFLQELRAGKQPKKITKKKTYLYIVRNNNEVYRHYLMQDEYEVLKKLLDGAATEEAVTSELISEMFPQWLQKWLIQGFFKHP